MKTKEELELLVQALEAAIPTLQDDVSRLTQALLVIKWVLKISPSNEFESCKYFYLNELIKMQQIIVEEENRKDRAELN